MRKLALLLAVLLILPVAFADFSLSSDETEQATCATNTILFILNVENTQGYGDSYTVSLSGDAAGWAVAAPTGFTLGPGESKNVYIYVTPASGALVGTYDLNVIVHAQHAGKKIFPLKVKVANCHSVTLSTDLPSTEACVCTKVTYPLKISNTGKYTENFKLDLSGSAAKWADLSQDSIKLQAGESAEINAYVTTACDAIGEYDLTVIAQSENSNALASQRLILKSNPCYEFDLQAAKTYLSFCENTEVKVPITIRNQGTAPNSYNLVVEGPSWAKLEQDFIELQAGEEQTVNLVLFPPYKVAGDFNIKVKAIGKYGEVATQKELTANVLTCHSTDLKIAAEEDRVCPYTSKAYEVSLANTGDYTEHYAITVNGADWASADETFVELSPSTTAKFNLVINPKDVKPGKYAIKVRARSQDSCETSDEDEIVIDVASKESCFGVETKATLDRVEVAYGEGALIPIVIENKGTEKSVYDLEVSGTGAAYVQLNPATIELEGKEADTVYMYVAVPESVPKAKYTVTVSARLEDGTVSSSSTIDIIVTSAEAHASEPKLELPTLPLPEREEVRANLGQKVSKITGGAAAKFSEGAAQAKKQLTNFKDLASTFLLAKTYGIFNWVWLVAVVALFAAIGAILKFLPEKNENKKRKNKGKGLLERFKEFLEEEEKEE